MTKSFRPSKIWNYLTWLNFSLSCWFSEVVFHSCFSKYVFLKSLQYWRLFLSYRSSFTEHVRWLRWLLLDFRSKKNFFQLNLVFIVDKWTGFCSGQLEKHEWNVRCSHWSCSVKKSVQKSSHPEVFLGKVFWKYTANLQENTYTEVWYQ